MGRRPYVGEGRDGCLRSAIIDEDEAMQYQYGSPEYDRAMTSAMSWREQAEES